MPDTLGIVQVREDLGLPLKVARRLGGQSLLEQVVRRVTDCQRLDAVIVLGSPAQEEALRQLVPSDVAVYCDRWPDPLAQVVGVLDAFGARCIVQLGAENPFIDPYLVDRLVSSAEAHTAFDYVSYHSADGRPAILSQLGLVAQWCRGDALRSALRQRKNTDTAASATSYLYAQPDRFRVRLLPLPSDLDRDDLRFDVDAEADWDRAQLIYEALGNCEWDWRRMADLLDQQTAGGRATLHARRAVA